MRRRIFSVLGSFSPRIRSLLFGQFLMNASHFMAIPLLAVFLTQDLQLSPAELGTVMAANLLCAQALPLLVGPLADRYGAKWAMVAGLLMRALGLVGFASQSDTVLLLVCACLSGSGVALYESALLGVFSREPPEQLAQVFTANNQMLNFGVILGPIVGALGSEISIKACFAGSAAVFGVLALRVLLRKDIEATQPMRSSVFTSLRHAFTDRRFRFMVLASMPWHFLFAQLYVVFPIYASRISAGANPSWIYVVNGVVGVAFMLLARRWLTRTAPQRQLLLAYLAAALLFASVGLSTSVWWFFVFIVGYTIVETTIFPATQMLTSTLARDGSQSTYFGLLSVAGAVAGSGGYYAGSWLVLRGNRDETWGAFGLVGVIGVLLTLLLMAKAFLPRLLAASKAQPRIPVVPHMP